MYVRTFVTQKGRKRDRITAGKRVQSVCKNVIMRVLRVHLVIEV